MNCRFSYKLHPSKRKWADNYLVFFYYDYFLATEVSSFAAAEARWLQ